MYCCHILVRDAGGGGAGGACAPPSFGISVNPIWTKGQIMPAMLLVTPPHLFGRCGVSEVQLGTVGCNCKSK